MNDQLQIHSMETRAASYVDYYSNATKLRFSPVDIVLIFMRSVQPPGQTGTNEELCSVAMSPVQFKMLAEQMQAALAAYEKAFGEILRPNLGPTVDTFAQNLSEGFEAMQKAIAQRNAETKVEDSSGEAPKPASRASARRK